MFAKVRSLGFIIWVLGALKEFSGMIFNWECDGAFSQGAEVSVA